MSNLDGTDSHEIFNGFQHDAAGHLVVTNTWIETTSGFKIFLAGDLRIGDRLVITGNVLLALSGGHLTLSVYGHMQLDPLGTLTVAGGFDVSTAGLVAWVDAGLATGAALSDLGLGVGISIKLGLNTTGAAYHDTVSGATVDPGFLVELHGNVTLLFVEASGFVRIRVAPSGFTLEFALQFGVGELNFSADGAAGIYSDGMVLRLNVHAVANLGIFDIDASGTIEVNTTGSRRLNVDPGFLLRLSGKVAILKVLNLDANLLIEYKDPTSTAGGWSWHLHADASVDFFGLAQLSGTVDIYDNGDFNVALHGRMVLGSDDFGLVGQFDFQITSTHYIADDDGRTYYRFFLGASASVKVRAFGITFAGIGLGFEVRLDTHAANADGGVPIVASVYVSVDLGLFSVGGTVSVTIGYLQFPPPVWMGSDGNLANGYYRQWNNNATSAMPLYLNVGSRNLSRNIGVSDIGEAMTIEQLGADSTGATIKVSAYGRSNTYRHVSEIHGTFGDGNDSLFVKPGVTVPVYVDMGADNDVVTYQGTNDCTDSSGAFTSTCTTIDGGSGNDFLSALGNAILDGGVGDDILLHTGGDKALLAGGAGNDKLFGANVEDQLYGDSTRTAADHATEAGTDGDDVLTGPAARYFGNGGDDLILIAMTGVQPSTLRIDGGSDTGTGSDILALTFGSGNDDITLSKASSSQVTMSYGLKGAASATFKSQAIDNLETINLDAGAGSDALTVHDLTGGPVTSLSLDLGRNATTNGTRQEPIPGSSFTHEVPDVRYSDDHATDTVLVKGSSTGGDNITMTTPSGGTHLATSMGYGIDLLHGVRGEGDTLDAVDLRRGRHLLRPRGHGGLPGAGRGESGAANDIVTGTSFADRIDSGLGNDTVTGDDGVDTFTDAGGMDTIKESFDRDFFLADNLLVIGRVASRTPGTGFVSGTVEDLGGLFEKAQLTGGAGNNTFLIGDADGTLGRAGRQPLGDGLDRRGHHRRRQRRQPVRRRHPRLRGRLGHGHGHRGAGAPDRRQRR